MDGDIQVVYHVAGFRFHCELKFGVYSVEVIQQGLDVCVGGDVYQQYVIHISEIIDNLMFS